MKIEEVVTRYETSGTMESHTFGIGDMGMIFDILRSKMYSDKIGAICREISCNARDAMREVGRQSEPIQIILPTSFDAHWRCRDTGPGISPDRIINVFIKYANSTKRDSNLQTGAYGLGAKSPWAYTDTFTITTVVSGTKYQYAAVIDDSKIGKLVLMNQCSTDEQNGTEICVPVMQKDFDTFADRTEQSTRWWDVQPKVSGGNPVSNRRPTTLVMKDVGWEIYARERHSFNSVVKVIIDGIEYDADESCINDFKKQYGDCNSIANRLFAGHKVIVCHFDNGTLKLNASREAISWDEMDSKKKVFDRLSAIATHVSNHITSEIEQAETYIEAIDVMTNLNRAFGSFERMFWRDLPIIESFRSYGSQMTEYSHKVSTLPVTRSRNNGYDVKTGMLVVVNDTDIKDLSVKKARLIFDKIPGLTRFTLVPSKAWDSTDSFKSYHEHILHTNLSNFIAPDQTSLKARKQKRMIYVFNDRHMFARTSVDAFEKDTGDKIFVLFEKRAYSSGFDMSLPDNVDIGELPLLIKNLSNNDVSVYGFDKKLYTEDPDSFDDFTDQMSGVSEYIKENIIDKMDVNEIFKYSQSERCHKSFLQADSIKEVIGHLPATKFSDAVTRKLEEKFCDFQVFQAYQVALAKVEKMAVDIRAFSVYSSVIHHYYPELAKMVSPMEGCVEIKRAYEAIEAKYPLLTLFLQAQRYIGDTEKQHLAEYIMLKEKA